MDQPTIEAGMTAFTGGQTTLNILITFVAMWLLRKLPAWKNRPVQFDFLVPVVVSALEAGVAAALMGKGLNEAWQLIVSNLAGAVSIHKLLTDAPGPYNAKSVANQLRTGVVGLVLPLAMFLCCGTLVTATACLPPSQGGGVDWPKVAQCAPDVGDVIGIVSRVLFGSGDVKAELAEVAKEYGGEAVTCAVKQLQNKFTAPGAASSPERTHASERAAAFLDEVGTKFEN